MNIKIFVSFFGVIFFGKKYCSAPIIKFLIDYALIPNNGISGFA